MQLITKKEIKLPTDKQFFQAVGVVVGDVKLEEKHSVIVHGNEYPLLYLPQRRGVLPALAKNIKKHGTNQRLIVYPRITHFPGREKSHLIAFELVGFESPNKPNPIAQELSDFEFKLAGLWQFIPVCKTPCISVFRNYEGDRLQQAKSLEIDKKARFLRPAHVPLLWRDAVVNPFRFNPRLDKGAQSKPYFVAVKAKFLPSHNLFGFSSLLSMPTEEIPHFIKLTAVDKAKYTNSKRAA